MSNQFTARLNTGRADAGIVSPEELDRIHGNANRKSMAVAYVLWFFLGGFGAHRFYVGRIQSGLAMPAITIVAMMLSLVVPPAIFLCFAVSVWWIVDAFLIPGMIRARNEELGIRAA